MPIARDDRGFMFWPDSWGAPSLGLESANLAGCVDEVQARGLTGVFGNTGFNETDLDCLLALPGLTSLQLWDITLRDLRPGAALAFQDIGQAASDQLQQGPGDAPRATVRTGLT